MNFWSHHTSANGFTVKIMTPTCEERPRVTNVKTTSREDAVWRLTLGASRVLCSEIRMRVKAQRFRLPPHWVFCGLWAATPASCRHAVWTNPYLGHSGGFLTGCPTQSRICLKTQRYVCLCSGCVMLCVPAPCFQWTLQASSPCSSLTCAETEAWRLQCDIAEGATAVDLHWEASPHTCSVNPARLNSDGTYSVNQLKPLRTGQ